MKYIFNFENREKPIQFNKEKLLLSSIQETEQLFYMMDTQYEGIYQAEAVARKRLYGSNSMKDVFNHSKFKFLSEKKQQILDVMSQLDNQSISVFRKGRHFYSEVHHEDLVPGDVLFLSPGDVIPSDIRIVFSKELEVSQFLYTGSEQPVAKYAGCNESKIVPECLVEIVNICFWGSIVLNGLARGVVISTGRATYLGHLLCM